MTAVPVLPDGTTDDAAEAEFWKHNAQLYLIEQVPFGTVTVQVPRNARDVEGYALGRRFLREEAALAEMHDARIEWAVRRIMSSEATEQMPGWTSTVVFKTRPLELEKPGLDR